MDEYIEEKTTYTINNKNYTVIMRCKKNNDENKIYELLAKYAIKEIKNNR